jgi:hypothetical protein
VGVSDGAEQAIETGGSGRDAFTSKVAVHGQRAGRGALPDRMRGDRLQWRISSRNYCCTV